MAQECDVRVESGVYYLALIGLSLDSFPKYRDCALFEKGQSINKNEIASCRTIIIRTHAGISEEQHCDSIERLSQHREYMYIMLDPFDGGVMNFYFRMPEVEESTVRGEL